MYHKQLQITVDSHLVLEGASADHKQEESIIAIYVATATNLPLALFLHSSLAVCIVIYTMHKQLQTTISLTLGSS